MREEFVGNTPAIQRLRTLVRNLALRVDPVVIVGESGTGKTLLASHLSSTSRDVRILNCSVLAEREQRLQLLGGGLPEISSTKRSILEHPGIVVVKNLDSAPHYIQDELVEAIQAGIAPRETRARPPAVNCRVVFTLLRPLRELRTRGKISSRCGRLLATCQTLVLPPLGNRLDDLPLLANHFARRFGLSRIDARDLHSLRDYRWPDNVRELKAVIRGLALRPIGEELFFREKLELMRIIVMIDDGEELSMESSLDRLRLLLVKRAMRRSGGRRSATARMLGISERSVSRLLGTKRPTRE